MNDLVLHHDMNDMYSIAKALAGSKLFGITTPEQALALCLIAQAEGRHPASAAQDYHIISGKPSKKADAMLRDFIGAGGKVEWRTLSDERADATFSHPAGGTVAIEWDIKRASTASLLGNAMWKKYPRQMLRARVVSEGVRTVFPMATSGMCVEEEARDIEAEERMRNVTPPRQEDQELDKGAPAPQHRGKAGRAAQAREIEAAPADPAYEHGGGSPDHHPEDVAFADGIKREFGECATLDELSSYFRSKSRPLNELNTNAPTLYAEIIAAKDARKAELDGAGA